MRPILLLAIAIALLTWPLLLRADDCASGHCRVERSRKVERGETKHERTVIRRGFLRR